MQKKFSIAILAALAIAGGALSGCSTVQSVKAYAKDAIMLPASDIGAPIAAPIVVKADNAAEVAVTTATAKAVKAMLSALAQPISLTAPVAIPPFISLNPEILSSKRFGTQLANEVGASLVADGYTVLGKSKPDPVLKTGANIRGTFAQVGRTLTVSVELLDSAGMTTLASMTFTLPIDGALRQVLDR
jgi:hypothetical protein